MKSERPLILIIDHNPEDRSQYGRYLIEDRRIGLVSEVESGTTGLARFKETTPDCVILAYSLPHECSSNILLELRKMDPYIPVIIVSGHGDELTAVKFMKLGVSDYLPKPTITREILADTVSRSIANTQLQRNLDRTHQQLRKRNDALKSFVRIASHDLKSPLTQIIGFSSLMIKHPDEDLSADMREYLEIIHGGARRMVDLLDNLLEFSRISTGEFKVSFRQIDLKEIVQTVLCDLKKIIDDTSAEIIIGDLPVIEAQRIQMLQVFQNLLSNAIKFRRHDITPKIEISSRVDDRSGSCEISVKDNGIGFEQQYAEQIFQPFQRLVSRSEYDGSGIGLSTVKRIVEIHGGEIKVKSHVGKGTTFVMTLPMSIDQYD